MISNGMLQIKGDGWSNWKTRFNLKYICEQCGVKNKIYWYETVDGQLVTHHDYETKLPKAQVRKIFQFIRKHTFDPDELEKIGTYILENGNKAARETWAKSESKKRVKT